MFIDLTSFALNLIHMKDKLNVFRPVHRQFAESDQPLPKGHGPANQEGQHGVSIAQREMPSYRPAAHRHPQRLT